MKIVENKLLNNISLIKCITMFFVVLHHSLLFYSGTWFTAITLSEGANYLYYISKLINIFIMPIFVFSSGFLFFYLKKNCNKYNNFKNDIKKRFNRLVIPYIFTSLFWAIPFSILFFGNSLLEIVKKYVLVTTPDQLWFLIMLFIEFVLFYVLSPKLKFSYFEFIVFFIITFILSIVINKNVFQISTVNKYFIFYYYAGFLINKKNAYQNDKLKFKFIFYILMILLLYICYFENFLNFNLYVSKFVLIFLQLIIVKFVYFICVNYNMKYITKTKVIKVLSSNSFGIYLFHQQLIYIVLYFVNGLFHPILISLCSLSLSILFSLLMVFILKKTKITKFMFGL